MLRTSQHEVSCILPIPWRLFAARRQACILEFLLCIRRWPIISLLSKCAVKHNIEKLPKFYAAKYWKSNSTTVKKTGPTASIWMVTVKNFMHRLKSGTALHNWIFTLICHFESSQQLRQNNLSSTASKVGIIISYMFLYGFSRSPQTLQYIATYEPVSCPRVMCLYVFLKWKSYTSCGFTKCFDYMFSLHLTTRKLFLIIFLKNKVPGLLRKKKNWPRFDDYSTP